MNKPARDDDTVIRDELRSLVPPVGEAEGWSAVQEKIRQARRRRSTVRIGVVVIVLGVLGAVTTALVLDNESAPSDVDTVAADPEGEPMSPTSSEARSPESAEAAMQVEAHVEPETVGPLLVRVTSPGPSANGWLEHDLVVTNESEHVVEFTLEVNSTVLEQDGESVLLVADDGCGYGTGPDGETVTPGCRLVERPSAELGPGESRSSGVTLWRELPGFAALSPESLATTRTLTVDGQSTPITLRYDIQ